MEEQDWGILSRDKRREILHDHGIYNKACSEEGRQGFCQEGFQACGQENGGSQIGQSKGGEEISGKDN